MIVEAQEETVTLVGGPADGQRMRWRGGDVYEHYGPLVPAGSLFASAGGHAPSRARTERFYYRRSIVTPTIFVFQP